MCRVDCDSETGIAKRFKITKYPTLKLSLNGDVMKREYRGQRKAEAVYQFVKDQLDDPIKVFTTLNELKNLDSKKRVVIAYFAHHDDKDYDVYRRVAANLKDECEFYAGFGEAVSEVHDGGKIGNPLFFLATITKILVFVAKLFLQLKLNFICCEKVGHFID